MMHKIKRIHFIGIGGSGMSGIAEVLHNLGYTVSGSDAASSLVTERLRDLGIKINIGHDKSNVRDVDVVVTSSAINNLNPEVIEAKANSIAVVPRAMMLAELMRFKQGIAIAGTHGKTTTTSLCAEILANCGLDPTFIIGGKLATTGSNAKLGSGKYLVAEADESDASFLYLSPLLSVITNIDYDHMSTYEHDERKLKQAFIDFVHQLPFYGRAILCNEDTRIKSIMPFLKRPVLTYGLDESCDIYAFNLQNKDGMMEFDVYIKELNLTTTFLLNLPGIHNVLNSLAAIAVGLECGGTIDKINEALTTFRGVGRRCQKYPSITINSQSIDIIDDYGHHPVEIKATITALKEAYPHKRLILLFQPHRYTRTRDLFDDFVSVLSSCADYLVILEVYAANEEPIALSDGRSLVRAIRLQGGLNTIFANDFEEAKSTLYNIVKDGDLIVTMGAGSISKLPEFLSQS